MAAERGRELKFQKSYFDVLGLCCSSEVPLIEKILQPLEGIEKVSVIVPTRTVIVVHNNLLISQIQIVKVLNQARLEANVRVLGEEKSKKMWPSPYTVACGVLLLLSIFKFLYHPMHWLALAATVVGLPPIVMRSIAAVRRFTLDVNILMLIAVGGAIALRDYWEAASIVFLFTIAEWLESRASHKATAVMSTLMSMAPQKAVLAENGQVVDARDVKVDTVLAVKAGEVIPIDGIVVEGKSEVDERTLTGESFPVTKQIQSRVWAGTMNLNGYISVKTTALAEDSAVARMAKLVEEAQQNKSKMQKIVDKCAKYYTPAIVLTSIGLAVVPTALRVHNVKYWYHLALVILVSACPCALILSTPTATFCALSQAATIGLLIKGGDYLEALTKTKIVAFDKTGTITRGEFTVTDFRSVCDDISLDVLLYWVASIESKSSHPMAAALVDYGRSNGVEPRPENVVEFQIFPGEGIYGEIDGKYIYVGNKRIAARAGCETVSGPEEMKEGITVGYVFSGATMIGTFGLSDTCRSGVAEAIAKLKSMGIKTAMLTGDSRGSAMHIQKQLEHAIGIVHAELLPEDKVTIIKELKKEGPTAMVGDGMNDAPALATADVGISMGISGSAVATETGHVTLMSNDIRKIPQAIELSFMTRQKIIQNVGLSIVTKVAIVVLAFSGHPLLWAAILADVGTCLLVIFNSMLILRPIGTRGDKCSRSSQVGKTHKDNSHKCCGSSTRVEHAKGTCGPVHCHLTHAHRRTCSQSRTPSTCENDKHGACGTTSHAQFKSCVKDDTCSSQVHVHCHGKDDNKGNGQTCDRGSCGSTSHAQFKSCVKDDTCSSHMHIHHHENHDDTGNGHTCDHETDEHTSCSNKDQNDTCTSSSDQIHPCLQLSTHTEHENENDHHDHHDHHHHDHHHQHQSSKCDRSEEKVSTCESKNLHHCPHVVDGAHVGDVHDRCASSTVGDVHGTCASSSESGMRRCCQPRDVTAHLSQIVIN